ncbi:hypothetical protein HA066_22405, partial [Escherichia coli]|nr:hypothetical protein [Escherichia coli]
GASTVGGAVAASALASTHPEDERDPREEDTARPGDGAVDGDREGRRADPTAEFDGAGDTAAGGAGYGSAAPTMVDPDTQTSDEGPSAAEAAVPTGAATLFDDATAQGFRDRWRDVQLRFVDDPRAAAGEAQSLVSEAMEALSAALAEHRNKLGGWQEAGA